MKELTPGELRQLQADLHIFKQSALYAHYKDHFATLYLQTTTQIIEEPLKGPETLYTRESWIGEARTAKFNLEWFELLNAQIEQKVRELD